MKRFVTIICSLLACWFSYAQTNTKPDVVWGNASYYNLNVGESILFEELEITLLNINGLYNTLKVGDDTLVVKLSQRTLPVGQSNIRLFIADNHSLAELDDDRKTHGLLTKDALICLSEQNEYMLPAGNFMFPISFNDGFLWNATEDSYLFAYDNNAKSQIKQLFPGIGIDLHDARGIAKHWIVAMEKSTVAWVEEKKLDAMNKRACVVLQSDSNPEIFYVYDALFNKNLEVKKGQKLKPGMLIGTAWGDDKWGHLHFAVVQGDSIPSYENRFNNILNFFPQFYELYFKQSYNFSKSFTRGKIEFGKSAEYNRNQKNLLAFEEYSGKGWMLGAWNRTISVESIARGNKGNARLRKVLFSNEQAKSKNPNNYFDYEVNVKNGVYRVRAQVGDWELPSWQKIDFEGVNAATYKLEAGVQKWTTERVVKITDRKLTVRIHVDPKNNTVAGLSEIVFQRAY